MIILQDNKRFVEEQFKLESDFEEFVRTRSKVLFGEGTIFISTKSKLKGLVLGASIPDGFLFDLTDLKKPEFYLVEVELQKHDFYRHIFPQITKFIGFFRNSASQNVFAKNLFSIINDDAALKSEFKKYLGDKEIFKFVKDVCEASQNILLVIDGDKEELPEIISTYSDTWGKLVKVMKVKNFTSENEVLVCVEPDFTDIQNPPVTEEVLEAEHKTPSQLAMMVAELSIGKNSNISILQAAKKLKVSRESAHVAKRILKASPQLAKLVKSGTLSLHAAEKKIKKLTEQD